MIGQRNPFDKVANDVQSAVIAADFMNRHNVGMVYPGNGTRLADKSFYLLVCINGFIHIETELISGCELSRTLSVLGLRS